MGKSKGGGPKSPTTKSTGAGITPEVQGKVDALRTEGQAQFLKKEFGKAAEAYSQAAQLLPDCDTKAELLQKKVGCLINLKKYKEAVKDATSVLQLSPNSPGALKSRARAYEQLGLYKQALADAQAVNRTDAATADTRDMEKRIRDAMAGKSSRPSSAASQPSRNAPYVPPITVKLSLNGDTRLVHVDYTVSYAELLELTREKFPTAGPVMLKYLDKDGDAIVISSRQDVQVALSDLVKAFHRQLQGAHAPKLGQQALPALKLQVVPVASEAEVPRPPVMELAERANTTSREADAAAAAAGAAPAPQPYEGEEWLMDFVRVFNEVTGVDPTAHLEHHQLGGDKLQRGMMEAVHSEAAEELLDDAAAHFRDAVVTSYVQWGNVFLVKADRALQALQKACTADAAKKWEGSSELQAAMAFYDKTVDMIKKALEVNPDGWECWAALGQVEWERAKAKMGYVVLPPPASQEDPSKTPEQLQAEMQAASTKAVEQVLAGISKERVDAVQPHVDKCNETYNKALEMANKVWAAKKARDAERAKREEAKKAAEAQKEGAGANGNAEAADKAEEKPEEADETLPLSSPPSNVLISHGNIIYELSQVYAVTGAHEWRPLLDEAAVKFRASGAPEADVRNALKNHLRKDELDLGPDPEPEAATPTAAGSSSAPAAPTASPAATAPAAEAAKAKGLPSLEVKKGKK